MYNTDVSERAPDKMKTKKKEKEAYKMCSLQFVNRLF